MKPIVKANWERALLVCGKCSGKVGGGFGANGRTPLAKALRREPGIGKGHKARIGVAEVKCLGVCPKRAVAVVDTADPGRWHVIPAGTDLDTVSRLLIGEEPETPAVAPLALVEVTEIVVVSAGDQPSAA